MQSGSKLPRNVWILGFVSLLMDLSSEIYHALLPAFITVTLGLPVLALGAIDGIAEATASFAKLASGRLSDRSRKRKPWVLLGYGLAALSKPLFPVAQGAVELMGARFADRVGKGIRGAPRDAIIADETPPEIRGRAFGLRQALDTVGALIAPLAAVGLMILFVEDIRAVFWIAMIPAALSFLLALIAVKEPATNLAITTFQPLFRGFRELDRPVRRLLAVVFLFSLARFSEGFLILRALDVGLSPVLSPLALVAFNVGFLALAYPAGALSDRMSPRSILMAGMGVLVSRQSPPRAGHRSCGSDPRDPAVGCAHGADAGYLRANDRRRGARSSPGDELWRFLLRQRHRHPAREPRGGVHLGPRRRRDHVHRGGRRRRRRPCHAQPSTDRPSACVMDRD